MRRILVANHRQWSRRLVERVATQGQCVRLSSSSASSHDSTTHFGFQNVATEKKEGLVREVFENVANSYDVMNDAMSVGIHRYWKDVLVQETKVGPMARAIRRLGRQQEAATSELKILDVAGGTGDVAFRMVHAADCLERSKSSGHDPVSVTVCDINPEMLRVGRQRAEKRYGGSSLLQDGSHALDFQEGNAQELPFEDDKFDLYTIAFGLRNVTDIDSALREACRVLKPGGRYFCLEFSHINNALFQQVYDVYSFHVIPTMGEAIANDRDSYQYLVESIRKFPKQEELVSKMELAGFQNCGYTNMTGGIVAIHQGWKPL